MKLCKDCKHMMHPYPQGWTVMMCHHQQAPIDPVNGEKYASCSLMRSANCLLKPSCGPRGDWFEESPPKPDPIQTPYELAVEMGLVEPKKSFWRRLFG